VTKIRVLKIKFAKTQLFKVMVVGFFYHTKGFGNGWKINFVCFFATDFKYFICEISGKYFYFIGINFIENQNMIYTINVLKSNV
jgi:hypothetical protein